ncbi:MAG: hypothetical protein P4M08_11340 [Oligoflexia bacterium]|nr:hypothetical protein [Oligoflexia bacterium]
MNEGGINFERGPISAYFEGLRNLLFRTTAFFRSVPLDNGLGGPLAFGLVSHWIGKAGENLWLNFLNSKTTSMMWGWGNRLPGIENLGRDARWHMAQQRLTDWLNGVSSVVLDPFFTVFWILFGAVLLFISARIFIGSVSDRIGKPARLREISFASAVRVIAYSQAAAVFLLIPTIGSFIAFWMGLWIIFVGIRELYNVTNGLALWVLLSEKLILFFVFGATLLAVFLWLITLVFVHL